MIIRRARRMQRLAEDTRGAHPCELALGSCLVTVPSEASIRRARLSPDCTTVRPDVHPRLRRKE
jgi:hypothetical protein